MIGEQVGDYKVVTKLGAGGMGVVYGAEHALLGHPAALKILHPALSSDREMVERFFNEAKAASAIRHPGIVEVYTFGYHTDGTAYLAMAYLEGISLEQRLRGQGKLPEDQALRLTSQIAGALGAAHGKHIVHRDLKPDNVYLVADADVPGGERIKLLDFGIAKLGERDNKYQTKTGAVFGTPAYMSPEQCRGAGEVDDRSDLYALGCILYRMVCGRLPFDGEDSGSGDVIAAQLRDEPEPPRRIDPSISEEVEAIALRLLAKDPAERYQSARELRAAITAILGESTGQTRAISENSAASAPTLPAPTTLGQAASQRLSEPRKPARTALRAAAGVVLVAAVGASVYFGVSAGDDEQATADAAPPPLPERVAATEAQCRDALARAAGFLAQDVPEEAVPYVHLSEFAGGGERAEQIVNDCMTGFDGRGAHCMAEAKSASDVARCGDEMVNRDCERGDTDACSTKGSIAYDRGEFALAFQLATKTCDQGGHEGCSLLGLLHYYGRGTEQSYEKAFRLYSRAAGLGDPNGMATAAMMLRFGVGVDKSESTALELYRDACEADDRGHGCNGLGEMLLGTEPERARTLFENTCAAGLARGCVLLADAGAADTDELYARARQLYLAQSKDSPYAARRLAEMIRDGKGGDPDPVAARELLSKACDDNEPFACESLGDLDVSGTVKLDLASSRKRYERACEAGLSRACERAECQRLSAEGRADDAAWRERLRACRESGALGPQLAGSTRRPSKSGGRKPIHKKPPIRKHGPRKPKDPVGDLL